MEQLYNDSINNSDSESEYYSDDSDEEISDILAEKKAEIKKKEIELKIEKEKLDKFEKKTKVKKILNDSKFHNRCKLIRNGKLIKHRATLHLITSQKDLKILIDNTEEYLLNNKVNQKHINRLKKEINQDTNFINTLVFFQTEDDDDDTIYSFDGHHRIKSMAEKPYDELLEEVIIQMYYVDNLESESTHKVFKDINNTKPFTEQVENISIKIISKLCAYFGSKCKYNGRKILPFKSGNNRTTIPYVHEPTFRSRLNTVIKSYLYNESNNVSINDIDVDDIVSRIIEINNDFASKKIIFKKKFESEKSKKSMVRKIKTLKFYLGLYDINNYLTEQKLFK
jgi:hypothetical protein